METKVNIIEDKNRNNVETKINNVGKDTNIIEEKDRNNIETKVNNVENQEEVDMSTEAIDARLRKVFPNMRSREEVQKSLAEKYRMRQLEQEPNKYSQEEWERKKNRIEQRWQKEYWFQRMKEMSYGDVRHQWVSLLEDYGREKEAEETKKYRKEEIMEEVMKIRKYEREMDKLQEMGYVESPLMNDPIYRYYCLHDHDTLKEIVKKKFPNYRDVEIYSRVELLEFLTRHDFRKDYQNIDEIPIKAHYMYHHFDRMKEEKLRKILKKYLSKKFENIIWEDIDRNQLLEYAVRNCQFIKEKLY